MFWDVFEILCMRIGKSPSAVAAELGLSNSTTTSWKNGSMPRIQTLQRIAKYFNVSAEYLIGEKNLAKLQQSSEMPGLNKEDREIAEYLQEIRDDPNKRMMFDLAKDATIEEIKATVAFLELLKGKRTEE